MDEAFCLSVGAGRIGPGAPVLESEIAAGAVEVACRIAGAVVGEDALDADVEPCVPGDGGVEEVGGRRLGLVRIHGGEGDARVVVDGDVEELGADALDAVAAVAGDAVGRALDAYQALDIEVQQAAWDIVLVAHDGWLRLDVAYPVEPQPAQDTADGGRPDLEFLCDPEPRPALAAQRFHADHKLAGFTARAAMGAARSVPESGQAFQPVAPDPLGHGLPAEPALGCRLAQAQPAFYNTLR